MRLCDFEQARENVLAVLAGKVSTTTAIRVVAALEKSTLQTEPTKPGPLIYSRERRSNAVRKMLDDIAASDIAIQEVDVSLWRDPLQAYDSIRHCIRDKQLHDISVFRRGNRVFVAKN